MKASSLAKKLLRGFPEEVQEYFYKLDKTCQKRRITLRLTSGMAVNNECGRCSGYFDSFGGELAVALGKGWEHAFSISLHEQMHMAQWMDKSSVWHTKISDNYTKFFQWLAGKNFKNPKTLAQAAMCLERDCERRVLTEIRKKYSHLIDPGKYTLAANAHLAGYFWCLENRSWFKKSPYSRKLMAHCPPKLFRTFADISDNLIAAMDRYL